MITIALPQSPDVAQLRDGLWTVTVDYIVSKRHAHPEDQRTPRADRPLTEQSRRWIQVLGVTADEVEVYMVCQRHTTPGMYGYESIERDVRLVSAKPFVVIVVIDPDEYHSRHRYGFVAAQEVRGGQLGRKPQLTKHPEVAASNVRDPGIGLERNVNWVRLSELAEITDIDPADIIHDYAPFSPSTMYEPNLPLASGKWTRPDIIRVYTSTELPQGYCGGEAVWGAHNAVTLEAYVTGQEWIPRKLWVPQSFANLVIRLASFGYRPGRPLPKSSCQIAAPMPARPQLSLPVLTVEELRKLHDLRMELVKELPEAYFRQSALSALGFPREARHDTADQAMHTLSWGSAWRKTPESDDGGSFRYYTDFEQIESVTAGDRVVIGTCYWTRGGHGPGEHYAGFLVVFPKGINVTDARRDRRAILRLWFWPGELMRETPNGSKGGLCPPRYRPTVPGWSSASCSAWGTTTSANRRNC